MRPSEDRHSFLADGWVTAVSRDKADADERAAAFKAPDRQRIIAGLIHSASYGERTTLVALHRLLFGQTGTPLHITSTHFIARRVADAARAGHLLLIPGAPSNRGYASSRYTEDGRTIESRLAMRIMSGRDYLMLDDDHYWVVSADVWSKIGIGSSHGALRPPEAAAILKQLATNTARPPDSRAALSEAVAVLSEASHRGGDNRLVVVRRQREVGIAALGRLSPAGGGTSARGRTLPPRVPRSPAHRHTPGHLRLTSQTNATAPSNRARTSVGVGERVRLTARGAVGAVTWTKTGNSVLSSSSGSSVTLSADDRAETTTVTARDGACGCTAPLTFRVIEPSGVQMERGSGTGLWHRYGFASVGILNDVFITPDTVSFENIEVSEGDAVGVVTGFFVGTRLDGMHHAGHGAGVWVPVGGPIAGHGSHVRGQDTAQSGNCSFRTPFAPGTFDWPIPWTFRVGTGTPKSFTTVHQRFLIDAAGGMTVTKGGASGAAGLLDPSSTY